MSIVNYPPDERIVPHLRAPCCPAPLQRANSSPGEGGGFFSYTSLEVTYPAPATASAAPPNKKAPRSECAIDTDR